MNTSPADDLQRQLDALGDEGNRLMDEERFDEALAIFRRGYDLIPAPREDSASALWFLVAIVDAQWFLRDLPGALDSSRDVILSGGFGNPFAHLRRGQVLYELSHEKEAANELLRALLLGGENVFAREPLEHWVFITSKASPPDGYEDWVGWPGAEPGSPIHDWCMTPPPYQFGLKKEEDGKGISP